VNEPTQITSVDAQDRGFKGNVDRVEVEQSVLRLHGWAINARGEPVVDLAVVLDGCELPLWELRRCVRDDVPKVLPYASPFCGFDLLVSLIVLPKSAGLLNVIARESRAGVGKILSAGPGAKINWEHVWRVRGAVPRWRLGRVDESVGKNNSAPLPIPVSVAPDARRVSAVNFVAVYGMPSNGKTWLCQTLSTLDEILWLHSDAIFYGNIAPNLDDKTEFWTYQSRPEGHFDIKKYVDSASYNQELFIRYLKEEIRRALQDQQDVQLVLLDGYVFKHHARIFADLGLPPERTLALGVSSEKGRYFAGEFDVTGCRYDEVLEHIRQIFRTKCLETTVPKSRYQNLDALGLREQGDNLASSDSDTPSKYAASRLDNIVHAEDRFADIGCNAGFFCFRVAEKTSGWVNGVDMVRSWLEVASHINNSIFRFRNVVFFEADAIDFLMEKTDSYEVVHCSSTYHYFRERQVDFLKAVRGALSRHGTLVLEVELADTGTNPEVIKRSRGVDASPCAFPNRAMFLEQIRGLFQVGAEFDSVFQRGSFYERKYFHLRPEPIL